MPQVPVYNTQQVPRAPLPSGALPTDASPSAFGATQGAQLQAAGNAALQTVATVDRVVELRKEQEDADKYLLAETSLKEKYTAFEAEARKRRGVNAWDLTKDAEKWWDAALKENAPTFSTQRAGVLYQRAARGMRLQSISSLSQYEEGQRVATRVDAASASIVATTNAVAANPTDESIKKGRDEIIQRVDIIAMTKGLDGYQRADLIAEKVGMLHKQVLAGLVNSDPLRAKNYYESNKKEIEGKDYAGIEDKLAIGVTKRQAPGVAAMLVQSGVTREKAMTEVRNKFGEDPNIDIYEREVAQAFAEREAAKRDRVTTLVDNVSSAFATRSRISDVSANDMAELKKLDGSTWAGLKEHFDAKIKAQAGEGSGLKTDYKVYGELYDQAGRDPEAFASRSLLAVRGKFKDADYEEMVRLQLSVRNSLRRTDASDAARDQKDLQSLQAQLAITYQRLGWGNKDAEKKGEFAATASDAIRSEEARKKAKLTDDERQLIINKLATTGEIIRPIMNRKATYAEALKEGKAGDFTTRMTIDQVPVSERERAAAYYAKRGVKATDANVMGWYRGRLGLLKPREIPKADLDALTSALKRRNLPVTDAAIVDLYSRSLAR